MEQQREVLNLLASDKDHYLITKKPKGCILRLLDKLYPGGDYSRGGMLRPWMVYDMKAFGIIAVAAIYSAINHGAGWDSEKFWHEEWRFRATIWWCKVSSLAAIWV